MEDVPTRQYSFAESALIMIQSLPAFPALNSQFSMEPLPAIRVLLIEDSESDADLIGIYLEDVTTADFHVKASETLAEGLDQIASFDVDVVLLDLSLPDSFGIETVVRVLDVAPTIAIIVLTGLDDEKKALEAMQVGAQDYLVKGQIDGILLSRTIQYSIERQKSRELQRQSDERLRLITQQLPAVVWTTDLNLRFTEPSVDFLVADPEIDVVGMSLAEYFGTDDEKLAPFSAHHRAASGESVSFDFKCRVSERCRR